MKTPNTKDQDPPWVAKIFSSPQEAFETDRAFGWYIRQFPNGQIAKGFEDGVGVVWKMGKLGKGISGIPGRVEVSAKHAHLISASNELFEALQVLIKQIEEAETDPKSILHSIPGFKAIDTSNARIAIAKAKGEIQFSDW